MTKSMYFNYAEGVSATDKAAAIAAAGFNGAELFRYLDDRQPLAEAHAAVTKAGLTVSAFHADFKQINDIWLDNADGNARLAFLEQCVKEAGALGIPVAVVHVSSSNTPPAYNALGLQRFKRLCQTGAEHGVQIAFENLRKTEYLDYVLENIPTAGFCFDVGHEHIYNGGTGVLEKHGHRMLCMHLHDNDGVKDNHYLPFEGTIDWARLGKRLGALSLKCGLAAEVFCKGEDYKTYPALIMEKLLRFEKLIK